MSRLLHAKFKLLEIIDEAEENTYGIDILAFMTIRKIISLYAINQDIPKEGFWVC